MLTEKKIYRFNNESLMRKATCLQPGDIIYFSGTVYTARDAAHARITAAVDTGVSVPFSLSGSIIYYAGPTEAPPGKIIGSCGPTTSSRMDKFTPRLMDAGVFATIGKGDRNADVYKSIVRNRGLYLCAIGGTGALMSKSIIKCEIIGYNDLGCESVKKIVTADMPLIVGINAKGESIYRKQIMPD